MTVCLLTFGRSAPGSENRATPGRQSLAAAGCEPPQSLSSAAVPSPPLLDGSARSNSVPPTSVHLSELGF